MSKLKKCPICNAEVKLMFLNCETFEDSVWDESIGNVPTWFRCYGCDSDFFHDEPIDIPEKQIEWWNTRKSMERIVERLEEEYDQVDKFKKESYEDKDWERFDMYSYENRGIYKATAIVKEEGGLHE